MLRNNAERGRLRTFSVFSALITVGAMMFWLEVPAQAYAKSGCRVASKTIKVFNPLKSSTNATIKKHGVAANKGLGRWNSSSTPVTFSEVGSAANAKVIIDEWSSLQNYWAVTEGTCQGGKFISKVKIRWNDGRTGGLSAGQKRRVASHEFGHVQGLDHVNPTCSGTKAVMVSGSKKWTCGWGKEPWADDINGVKALY